MNEQRTEKGFLEALFGIEVFRSFAVKLGLFIVSGLGMNRIENEAVCYGIICLAVIWFICRILFEGAIR